MLGSRDLPPRRAGAGAALRCRGARACGAVEPHRAL